MAESQADFNNMLRGTKMPLDTTREGFVAIAKSQDNNEHLKQFLHTKWYALPVVFSEEEKANPKSEACKELKNLLCGAVTGRHKRAKTAAKDNYHKQQAQKGWG